MERRPRTFEWTTLASLLTAIAAIAALYFTNQSLQASGTQQVTDRFGKAVEQLASEKLTVRHGGIYALERLAQDSPRDHSTIMEILTAFVRTQAPLSSCPQVLVAEPVLAVDVQSALTVIGRRATKFDSVNRLDLSKTCLRGANLSSLDFGNANFNDADLGRSLLWRTKLRESIFWNTVFTSSSMIGADFTGAQLASTKFTSAELDTRTGGKYTMATNLALADFTRADLSKADFTGANVEGVALTEAQRREAVGLSH
ncbi:Pentapeptide repeat-containing protein [Actinokineospora alba]|uniref:Pentapeptide repeat-containing protein n=1 Tax=Actinokineospora alba TaxID=504798 RepID=A0A1H0VD99_9PSEU|nr:pentapeptide repeat-containing protein [Actinokineospora alba]TDP65645.1 pentapeptide repeat protein [Actinokineospora alba]SDH67433.1 Pentapeptide repeat-containing protein [Actinokineospora alba]SDP76311.1 Pentapeptide repeat-containing protein [Actinokineospora alba]